ncbi:hypothetical protein GOBAR_DD17314 [Gossypium barbadense]|nr:hypothetical protein GOBAR_DD17314 [Gossypium barbadense]
MKTRSAFFNLLQRCGLMNKMSGRIGDSPIIGVGTYACELCGVSCTGEGEAIIRSTLARDVAAVMEYKGLNLHEAVDYVIKNRLDEGKNRSLIYYPLNQVVSRKMNHND